MKSSTKVVTVFGGSGFVGRYVVSLLAKDGWQVRVPVRDPHHAKFLCPCGDVGQVVPLVIDVFDEEAVSHVIAGSDAVVNLIGILFEGGRQRFDYLQASLPGVIGLAAKHAGVRALIQMSAIGADVRSFSAYGRSKAEGELAAKSSFPGVTIMRPSIIFGPEDDFFNRFARMSVISPFLPLIDGGRVKFQPVYVGDVAHAILKAVNNPKDYGGSVYELGGPRVLSFRRCLEVMLRQIRRDRLFVSLPMWIAKVQAFFFGVLPNPPLTLDQLKMLQNDNVVSSHALGVGAFGIDPVDVELILPTYLSRYRSGGGK
ncbi:complex I NDUFA9 subunit family protein [Kiloniella antarctica]|uniref:Complex I NDUFA9 subunit family protein n=1 Tax=Kiloniella antarctica TaxID=1550907 RepID=A0ABW5BEM7_9PROT